MTILLALAAFALLAIGLHYQVKENNSLKASLKEHQDKATATFTKAVELDVSVKQLKELQLEKQTEIYKLQNLLELEKQKNEEIISRKKSSETKLGTIAENTLVFLKDFPYESCNLRHLGSPVDYIYFNLYGSAGPEIVIIEVKSGNSKESKRQKLIKNAVKLGKVYYEEIRVDEKGCKIKRANNTN